MIFQAQHTKNDNTVMSRATKVTTLCMVCLRLEPEHNSNVKNTPKQAPVYMLTLTCIIIYAINIHCVLPLATKLIIFQKAQSHISMVFGQSLRGLHNVRKPCHHTSKCGGASAYTTFGFADLWKRLYASLSLKQSTWSYLEVWESIRSLHNVRKMTHQASRHGIHKNKTVGTSVCIV